MHIAMGSFPTVHSLPSLLARLGPLLMVVKHVSVVSTSKRDWKTHSAVWAVPTTVGNALESDAGQVELQGVERSRQLTPKTPRKPREERQN